MRTRILGVAGALFVAVALVLGIGGTVLAQQAGPSGGWGPGGMMGGYGNGYQRGPGMMGGGYYGGGMMGGWGWSSPANSAPQTLDDAKAAVEQYLSDVGLQNMEVKEVMEFQYNFYAIVGQPGAERNAMELLVDKGTGNVFPEYGPNMMWNTEYGHMGGYAGGMMGGWWRGGVADSVTAEQAQQIAQQWLDANFPGSTTEHPDAFPGYYTLHIEKDGTVTGMLSVNASTGQVWYHSWHGQFIAMTEE